jgi:hypothetical protein
MARLATQDTSDNTTVEGKKEYVIIVEELKKDYQVSLRLSKSQTLRMECHRKSPELKAIASEAFSGIKGEAF